MNRSQSTVLPLLTFRQKNILLLSHTKIIFGLMIYHYQAKNYCQNNNSSLSGSEFFSCKAISLHRKARRLVCFFLSTASYLPKSFKNKSTHRSTQACQEVNHWIAKDGSCDVDNWFKSQLDPQFVVICHRVQPHIIGCLAAWGSTRRRFKIVIVIPK